MTNFTTLITCIEIFLVFGLLVFGAVTAFLKLPIGEQKKKIKEWLLIIVTEMEKAYGSGTGKIKLRAAYNEFILTFPFAAVFLSFEKFSDWVDEALVKMRHLIETNTFAEAYVTSDHVEYTVLEETKDGE